MSFGLSFKGLKMVPHQARFRWQTSTQQKNKITGRDENISLTSTVDQQKTSVWSTSWSTSTSRKHQFGRRRPVENLSFLFFIKFYRVVLFLANITSRACLMHSCLAILLVSLVSSFFLYMLNTRSMLLNSILSL